MARTRACLQSVQVRPFLFFLSLLPKLRRFGVCFITLLILFSAFVSHVWVLFSLTSVGNIKREHKEARNEKPTPRTRFRENQEQESRNPPKDPERKHQQTPLSLLLGVFATWVQSPPPPSLSPPLWFDFSVFVVWVLFFMGFYLGFKVSRFVVWVLFLVFGFQGFWVFGFCSSWFGFCSS